MPTLDATVGGASSNSYAVVADADTYFDERLRSTAWSGEDADDKERALIMATRRIDEEDFEGSKDSESQALKWPRVLAFVDGVELGTDAIPDIIERATYELALVLLQKDDDSEDYLQNSGLEAFKNVGVGPISVTPRYDHEGGNLPDNVRRILGPVLRSTRLSGRLLRA